MKKIVSYRLEILLAKPLILPATLPALIGVADVFLVLGRRLFVGPVSQQGDLGCKLEETPDVRAVFGCLVHTQVDGPLRNREANAAPAPFAAARSLALDVWKRSMKAVPSRSSSRSAMMTASTH